MNFTFFFLFILGVEIVPEIKQKLGLSMKTNLFSLKHKLIRFHSQNQLTRRNRDKSWDRNGTSSRSEKQVFGEVHIRPHQVQRSCRDPQSKSQKAAVGCLG